MSSGKRTILPHEYPEFETKYNSMVGEAAKMSYLNTLSSDSLRKWMNRPGLLTQGAIIAKRRDERLRTGAAAPTISKELLVEICWEQYGKRGNDIGITQVPSATIPGFLSHTATTTASTSAAALPALTPTPTPNLYVDQVIDEIREAGRVVGRLQRKVANTIPIEPARGLDIVVQSIQARLTTASVTSKELHDFVPILIAFNATCDIWHYEDEIAAVLVHIHKTAPNAPVLPTSYAEFEASLRGCNVTEIDAKVAAAYSIKEGDDRLPAAYAAILGCSPAALRQIEKESAEILANPPSIAKGLKITAILEAHPGDSKLLELACRYFGVSRRSAYERSKEMSSESGSYATKDEIHCLVGRLMGFVRTNGESNNPPSSAFSGPGILEAANAEHPHSVLNWNSDKSTYMLKAPLYLLSEEAKVDSVAGRRQLDITETAMACTLSGSKLASLNTQVPGTVFHGTSPPIDRETVQRALSLSTFSGPQLAPRLCHIFRSAPLKSQGFQDGMLTTCVASLINQDDFPSTNTLEPVVLWDYEPTLGSVRTTIHTHLTPAQVSAIEQKLLDHRSEHGNARAVVMYGPEITSHFDGAEGPPILLRTLTTSCGGEDVWTAAGTARQFTSVIKHLDGSPSSGTDLLGPTSSTLALALAYVALRSPAGTSELLRRQSDGLALKRDSSQDHAGDPVSSNDLDSPLEHQFEMGRLEGFAEELVANSHQVEQSSRRAYAKGSTVIPSFPYHFQLERQETKGKQEASRVQTGCVFYIPWSGEAPTKVNVLLFQQWPFIYGSWSGWIEVDPDSPDLSYWRCQQYYTSATGTSFTRIESRPILMKEAGMVAARDRFCQENLPGTSRPLAEIMQEREDNKSRLNHPVPPNAISPYRVVATSVHIAERDSLRPLISLEKQKWEGLLARAPSNVITIEDDEDEELEALHFLPASSQTAITGHMEVDLPQKGQNSHSHNSSPRKLYSPRPSGSTSDHLSPPKAGGSSTRYEFCRDRHSPDAGAEEDHVARYKETMDWELEEVENADVGGQGKGKGKGKESTRPQRQVRSAIHQQKTQ
ncbi:hypothetical protein P7C70_g7600, partial [Phenoliferia sp. Uapishka_3]